MASGVSASFQRHGLARPDHQPEQAGQSEFEESDGPVEPDHDVFSTVSVHRPICFRAFYVAMGLDPRISRQRIADQSAIALPASTDRRDAENDRWDTETSPPFAGW